MKNKKLLVVCLTPIMIEANTGKVFATFEETYNGNDAQTEKNGPNPLPGQFRQKSPPAPTVPPGFSTIPGQAPQAQTNPDQPQELMDQGGTNAPGQDGQFNPVPGQDGQAPQDQLQMNPDQPQEIMDQGGMNAPGQDGQFNHVPGQEGQAPQDQLQMNPVQPQGIMDQGDMNAPGQDGQFNPVPGQDGQAPQDQEQTNPVQPQGIMDQGDMPVQQPPVNPEIPPAAEIPATPPVSEATPVPVAVLDNPATAEDPTATPVPVPAAVPSAIPATATPVPDPAPVPPPSPAAEAAQALPVVTAVPDPAPVPPPSPAAEAAQALPVVTAPVPDTPAPVPPPSPAAEAAQTLPVVTAPVPDTPAPVRTPLPAVEAATATPVPVTVPGTPVIQVPVQAAVLDTPAAAEAATATPVHVPAAGPDTPMPVDTPQVLPMIPVTVTAPTIPAVAPGPDTPAAETIAPVPVASPETPATTDVVEPTPVLGVPPQGTAVPSITPAAAPVPDPQATPVHLPAPVPDTPVTVQTPTELANAALANIATRTVLPNKLDDILQAVKQVNQAVDQQTSDIAEVREEVARTEDRIAQEIQEVQIRIDGLDGNARGEQAKAEMNDAGITKQTIQERAQALMGKIPGSTPGTIEPTPDTTQVDTPVFGAPPSPLPPPPPPGTKIPQSPSGVAGDGLGEGEAGPVTFPGSTGAREQLTDGVNVPDIHELNDTGIPSVSPDDPSHPSDGNAPDIHELNDTGIPGMSPEEPSQPSVAIVNSSDSGAGNPQSVPPAEKSNKSPEAELIEPNADLPPLPDVQELDGNNTRLDAEIDKARATLANLQNQRSTQVPPTEALVGTEPEIYDLSGAPNEGLQGDTLSLTDPQKEDKTEGGSKVSPGTDPVGPGTQVLTEDATPVGVAEQIMARLDALAVQVQDIADTSKSQGDQDTGPKPDSEDDRYNLLRNDPDSSNGDFDPGYPSSPQGRLRFQESDYSDRLANPPVGSGSLEQSPLDEMGLGAPRPSSLPASEYRGSPVEHANTGAADQKAPPIGGTNTTDFIDPWSPITGGDVTDDRPERDDPRRGNEIFWNKDGPLPFGNKLGGGTASIPAPGSYDSSVTERAAPGETDWAYQTQSPPLGDWRQLPEPSPNRSPAGAPGIIGALQSADLVTQGGESWNPPGRVPMNPGDQSPDRPAGWEQLARNRLIEPDRAIDRSTAGGSSPGPVPQGDLVESSLGASAEPNVARWRDATPEEPEVVRRGPGSAHSAQRTNYDPLGHPSPIGRPDLGDPSDSTHVDPTSYTGNPSQLSPLSPGAAAENPSKPLPLPSTRYDPGPFTSSTAGGNPSGPAPLGERPTNDWGNVQSVISESSRYEDETSTGGPAWRGPMTRGGTSTDSSSEGQSGMVPAGGNAEPSGPGSAPPTDARVSPAGGSQDGPLVPAPAVDSPETLAPAGPSTGEPEGNPPASTSPAPSGSPLSEDKTDEGRPVPGAPVRMSGSPTAPASKVPADPTTFGAITEEYGSSFLSTSIDSPETLAPAGPSTGEPEGNPPASTSPDPSGSPLSEDRTDEGRPVPGAPVGMSGSPTAPASKVPPDPTTFGAITEESGPRSDSPGDSSVASPASVSEGSSGSAEIKAGDSTGSSRSENVPSESPAIDPSADSVPITEKAGTLSPEPSASPPASDPKAEPGMSDKSPSPATGPGDSEKTSVSVAPAGGPEPMDQPAGGEGTPGKTWEDDGETNENPLEKITDDSNYRGLLDDLQEHLETLERLTGALPGSSGRGNDVAQ